MNQILTWKKLLELAKKESKIIVTGCQRSGTTFAADAIASALGYKFIDELKYGIDNVRGFNRIFNNENSIVIHAPALLHILPEYQNKAFIVYVERSIKEVVDSMNRVDWFNRYGVIECRKINAPPPSKPEDVYLAKLNFASSFKNLRLNYLELQYSSKFIVKRENWSIKQITPKINLI